MTAFRHSARRCFIKLHQFAKVAGEKTMKLIFVILLAAITAGCGGYGSHSTTPPVPASTPVVAQLVPNNANSSGPAFTLEVDGTAFSANAVINFNGTKETTTFVNATKLTTMIPASAIASSGPVPVTVTNPGTAGGQYGGGTSPVTSLPMTFTVK